MRTASLAAETSLGVPPPGRLRCQEDLGSARSAAAFVVGSPVDGLRNSAWFGGFPAFDVKLNMDRIDPAAVSAAPLPSAGRCQLNSMNFRTELWPVKVVQRSDRV